MVSFGVRDYSVFWKALRGFREVGNRICRSFVGLAVGNSVRGPDSVSLLYHGFRFELKDASRSGHSLCSHLGHREYRNSFRKSDRMGLVERVTSGDFRLVS